MEEQVPEVYQTFLETPADWLEGVKPGEYFDGYSNSDALVRLMSLYIDRHISVPDMLMNRLVEIGGESEKSLMALLDDEGAGNEKKMLAVSLLRELDSSLPLIMIDRPHAQKGRRRIKKPPGTRGKRRIHAVRGSLWQKLPA